MSESHPRRQYKAEVYFDAPVCEHCGDIFHERANDTIYPTAPYQADFVCRGCGAVKRFSEPQWPGYKYRIVDELGKETGGDQNDHLVPRTVVWWSRDGEPWQLGLVSEEGNAVFDHRGRYYLLRNIEYKPARFCNEFQVPVYWGDLQVSIRELEAGRVASVHQWLLKISEENAEYMEDR